MIKNLRKKISLIIFFAISIPLIIIISLYTYSYYDNTIDSNTKMVDRFFGAPNGGPDMKKDKGIDLADLEGIYSVSVNDNKVESFNGNVSAEIKKLALQIAKKNKETGIIKNYIYKVRIHEFNNNKEIILIESSNEIRHINIIIVISINILIILIVIAYFLSLKIASIIVSPVEETFNKQRDFISDASHELKTPLAVLQANADVLEGEIGRNKWLTYIQNETDNMSKLINELLLLTKIENIDKLREPEKFNMSNHIELIASTFESMAFEKKVKIETKIEKDIITDKFNKDDIEHILSTLIDNAIKHTDENKKVIIELLKKKNSIEINVKNKGEEIPILEREKIFDRFYRIDKSRNRNEKRYGLGLSIAKSTVIKNKGTIKVDYKDKYTIFTVDLPL